ncbi:ferredoxin [Phenylobacterium sp.]|uniref:ferredoxin n=1 Tax=Phenylobacterium sp. TaxID=1871053 RepID=UPI002F42E8DA
MRIRTEPMACIASGACRRTAPALFGADADGVVTVLQPQPAPDQEALAQDAAAACPAAAIHVEDEA